MKIQHLFQHHSSFPPWWPNYPLIQGPDLHQIGLGAKSICSKNNIPGIPHTQGSQVHKLVNTLCDSCVNRGFIRVMLWCSLKATVIHRSLDDLNNLPSNLPPWPASRSLLHWVRQWCCCWPMTQRRWLFHQEMRNTCLHLYLLRYTTHSCFLWLLHVWSWGEGHEAKHLLEQSPLL